MRIKLWNFARVYRGKTVLFTLRPTQDWDSINFEMWLVDAEQLVKDLSQFIEGAKNEN